MFFSSRRRHTRYWRDWSSDVCSSDLGKPVSRSGGEARAALLAQHVLDPAVEVLRLGVGGGAVGVEIGRASCRERSVDLGGRRSIKKKRTLMYLSRNRRVYLLQSSRWT